MGVIRIVNPQRGVAWRARLQWMLKDKPQITWQLFLGDQLVEYLNAYVAHVVEYRGGLISKGIDKAEAELYIAERLLQDFSTIDITPLTADQEAEIMQMVDALEDKTYEVEL